MKCGVILLTIGEQKVLGGQGNLQNHILYQELVSRLSPSNMSSINLHDNLLRYFYHHLMDEETKARRA